MDPNYAHEFNPSRKGLCKTIVSGQICHLRENAEVHTRYAMNSAIQQAATNEERALAQLSNDLIGVVHDELLLERTVPQTGTIIPDSGTANSDVDQNPPKARVLIGTHLYAGLVARHAPAGYVNAPLYAGRIPGRICAGPGSDTITTVFLLDSDDGAWFRALVEQANGAVREEEL